MKYNKKQLNDAFRELRKNGFFARQNFWCCQSCAWNAMKEEEAEKAVFYHRQDAEDIQEKGECWLAWSGDGNEIVRILNEHNIHTKWNGKISERIHVKLNPISN